VAENLGIKLTKWTKPLHYKGRLTIGVEIERKPYGPNLDHEEYFWPVKATYDEETDMTTVEFAMVVPDRE